VHAFEYHCPGSLKEAISLGEAKTEGRYLAGGQSLVQAMKLRLSAPTDLVDLGALQELKRLDADPSGVTIGAMVRHAEVAASQSIRKLIPALGELAGLIGDRQVRNLGTIGGSLANGDPAADYPAAVLALNATIVTNKRKIGGDEFFTGLYETALQAGELLTSVAFQVPKRAAYMKCKSPSSGFALVGVFVADFGDHTRVGVTGAGASAFRQLDMEQALTAKFAPESVANIRVKADRLNNDLHATPQYRAHLIAVLARRAVEATLEL
jgi:carbon-monoxide dehydrogenase medium subunit